MCRKKIPAYRPAKVYHDRPSVFCTSESQCYTLPPSRSPEPRPSPYVEGKHYHHICSRARREKHSEGSHSADPRLRFTLFSFPASGCATRPSHLLQVPTTSIPVDASEDGVKLNPSTTRTGGKDYLMPSSFCSADACSVRKYTTRGACLLVSNSPRPQEGGLGVVGYSGCSSDEKKMEDQAASMNDVVSMASDTNKDFPTIQGGENGGSRGHTAEEGGWEQPESIGRGEVSRGGRAASLV